jgi:hypothetical protein
MVVVPLEATPKMKKMTTTMNVPYCCLLGGGSS